MAISRRISKASELPLGLIGRLYPRVFVNAKVNKQKAVHLGKVNCHIIIFETCVTTTSKIFPYPSEACVMKWLQTFPSPACEASGGG